MTKSTFRATASNRVELAYDDEVTGERIVREFWIDRAGGVIWEDIDEGSTEVCARLSHQGMILRAGTADDMLATLRREWRLLRQAQRRDYQQYMARR